jgi:hypothetical protein
MKLKYVGYFLHKYMEDERPKTLDEWGVFLKLTKSALHERVNDGTFIKIVLSNDNIEMFCTVNRTKSVL